MNHRSSNEAIAIIGMSCRLPQSNTVEEFWNLLEHGVDATSIPPDHRWLQRDYPTPILDTFRNFNAGFLPDKVDEFDAVFFGISPKEAVFMDPQQRLLHQLVWEGLEDAGIDPTMLKGTNGGVFSGSWTNDYKDILLRCGYEEFYRRYMGNSIGAAAAKISFLLGMTGPSIATESGCSSGMVAVHMACKSLQKGETNMALACGVNLLLKPYNQDELPVLLSPNGRCRPFDSMADGFGRAEGGGVLVLKRLSDAIKDGDRVWACIRGSAISQEGLSMSMGTPTVHAESLAMEMALKDAEIDPSQVAYVEAHGTGTAIGDPMEILAISKAYKTDKRPKPLLIGSVKGNVGHTESCSGITGIIRVILSMHHGKITKQINFTELNPSIDLAGIPAEIPLDHVEWNRGEIKRIAGISSFGITGTDAHVILEEAPLKETKACAKERPLHLLKVTAKSEEALNILLDRYKDLARTSNETLSDIAFATNTGRTNFKYRAAIMAKSKEEIADKIEQKMFLLGECEPSEQHGKICFLFTGQGSQYPGMAKTIYDNSPVFMKHFDTCDNFLKEKYQIDIKEAIWGTNSHEISRTIYSQTSIFFVEYALLKLWESWGIKPDYVLGHSLGEYAAAVCAEILTVEDALTLIAERSLLIDQLPRGKMLVIKASKKEVESALERFVEAHVGAMLDYAAINSYNQTVVAGNTEEILDFSKWCAEKGIKNIILEATHAFHSHHMDPILEKYRQVAETIKPRGGQSKCRYISGVLGKLVNRNDASCFNAEYCVQHTRSPVLFLEASQTAVREGCNIFVEIGPQPVLSALTMMNNENVSLSCLPSLKRNGDDWNIILNSLGSLFVHGLNIDWAGFDKPYLRKRVQLPHYPFIGKRFWPEVPTLLGPSIHPFLGQIVPNPLPAKLFQSNVNLKSLQYLEDHVVGKHVVFPGAGYLEMCLAAGMASIESSSDSLFKTTRPVAVKNLVIEAPLVLDESSSCELHTVVDFGASKENWNDVPLKIFHRPDSRKWVSHAHASFEILASDLNKEFENFDTSIISSSEGDIKYVQQVYNQLSLAGLNFGSNFLSLDRVWKKVDSTDSQLVRHVFRAKELNVETKTDSYVIHPIILDAMIQAIMFSTLEDEIYRQKNIQKKMPLPVKIEKFVLLPNRKTFRGKNFIHIFPSKNGKIKKTAVLADSLGQVKCIMSQVEFVETTIKSFDAVVRQQTCSMPDLWEETWKQNVDFSKYQLDLKRCTESNFYSVELLKEVITTNENPPVNILKVYGLLKQLSYLNMLKALLECGWKAEVGNIFSIKDLQNALGIAEDHSKYFGFVLTTLEEEGIISNVGEEKWQLQRSLPSAEEVNEMLMSPVFTVYLTQQYKASLMLSRIGDNLADILQGKQSALRILFPSMEVNAIASCPSAADYYEEYTKISGCTDMAKAVLYERMNHFREKMEGKPFILRILEVGAGTGGFTGILLQALEDARIAFEYTYTDISSSFFSTAERKFEKHAKQMKFLKLNIEEDPLVQGLLPEYYDYVCGYDVIHATKDIGKTLLNLRTILKPYGKFDILDTTKVNRYVTYVWGLLKGYWMFEDHHLRKNHCTIDNASWKRVFNCSGFVVENSFPVLMENHSLICTYHDGTEPKENLARMEQQKQTWLVFHTDEAPISEYLIKKLVSLGREVIIVSDESSGKRLSPAIVSSENITWICANFDCKDEPMSLLMDSKINLEVLEGVLYCFTLDKSRKSQEQILKPLFQFTKKLASKIDERRGNALKLIILTQSSSRVNELNDMSGFHSSTVWGFCKSLGNETINLSCRCIDVEKDCSGGNENSMLLVFQELFNNDNVCQVAFRGSAKFSPKLQALRTSQNQDDLKFPSGEDRFQLILPKTKSISDLKFGSLEHIHLDDHEVEIKVKASALNFRDVLTVLKPTSDFEALNVVGFDFVGEVIKTGRAVSKWKPGDFVCGLNFDGKALPSHLKLHEDIIIRVPTNVTLWEAVTLPAVFATAYHCLIEIARLKPNDYVLLHTASGGVGLSAIDICKNVGAKIIVTAGSKVKRRYLRSLGIDHVFHSRNTSYCSDIMKVTNGHGVDVVLNSLTSEGFKEATLSSCAKGARFVEMSKMNIWKVEEVKTLRPDVNYTVVDISASSSNMLKRLMGKLHEYLAEKHIVKPLPYVRFSAVNIREALQFLQKAKHIGKVVCSMPEFKRKHGNVETEIPMFNEGSTYLITGGLGGIGLLVCKWMVEKGAKHIVLAGRSPPKPEVATKIDEINKSMNANVFPVQLDVGNFEECKHLVDVRLPSAGVPPLKGIMHAAGTLADGLIVNQTWDKLSLPFDAKVKGSLNLHEVTKDVNLEFFVLFSSVAAVFGTRGQSNHAAANQFEDAFTHYRRSIGLPATTINWGPWCEVGVATDVDVPGIRSISNLEGLAALELALRSHRSQTIVLNVDSFPMFNKFLPKIGSYIDEVNWKQSEQVKTVSLKPDQFWSLYNSKEHVEEKEEFLKSHVKNILVSVLKLTETDDLGDDKNFHAMGVDSLMFVEIRNSLQALFGDKVFLNVNTLQENNTLNLITKSLVQTIELVGSSHQSIVKFFEQKSQEMNG